jgi:NAD(P)-dependent dehydrogenase (short-subunit alcohol dehydrogenase family)
MRLEGLKVIITGGASGLGAATVRTLARHSCRVAIWDQNEALGRELAAECNGVFFKTDVTDIDSVQASLAATVAEFKRVDVLLNSAGVFVAEPVIGVPFENTAASLDLCMRVNLMGTVNVAVTVARQMVTQDEVDGERGVIINMSSILAELGKGVTGAYSTSKGAVKGMTLPLARELGAYKVRVNSIAPTVIATPMTAGFPKEAIDAFTLESPIGRLGTPQDLADMVTFIISHPFMTGNCLPLDAGGVLFT